MLRIVTPASGGAGEKASGGPGVVLVPRRVDAREHEHLIPERLQGLQDGRELEVPSLPLRRPMRHRHAVRHVIREKPVGGLPDRLGEQGEPGR